MRSWPLTICRHDRRAPGLAKLRVHEDGAIAVRERLVNEVAGRPHVLNKVDVFLIVDRNSHVFYAASRPVCWYGVIAD
jgi:hypothetical protein